MAELITGYSIEYEEIKESHDESNAQYLTFLIAGETFAVGILDVNEIIEVSEMTDVPMMPEFIRGVINLRGAVVPVIDLAARMERGRSELDKRSCIVLVETPLSDNQYQVVGMLVDSVNEIVEISEDHIQPAPAMGKDIDTRFIKAMGRVDELFFVLLDIENILSNEQITNLEQLKRMHQSSATAL